MTDRWISFPYPSKTFDYAGNQLEKNWNKLHAGDLEPYPEEKHVSRLITQNSKLGKRTDSVQIAAQLQEAWRCFHKGDFQQAYELGTDLGPIGMSVAVKAGGIHATYLLDDKQAKEKRYWELAQIAKAALDALPDEANSHYRHAYALGRYSQCISIAKALAQGLARQVKESLDCTLKLAPNHAEAHSALGIYHAEIIHKVGSMISGLTYGVKISTGEILLKRAIELTPDSPIAWVEYANGLLLMHGDKKEDEAAEAFDKAAKLKPKDAMEVLDALFAKDKLA